MDATQLPKLVYLGDVPVEATYHGSALLYRLLDRYPSQKLLVIESSSSVSQVGRRLPHVRYEQHRIGIDRFLFTRFAVPYRSLLLMVAPLFAGGLARRLADFHPEAILTVAHGHLWRLANALSKRLRIPLHLICHDEIANASMCHPALAGRMERDFAACYRHAAQRYCVSPSMRDDYRRRFGVSAEVLYPSRAVDGPTFAAPPERLASPIRNLTVAFAGTYNTGGMIELLRLQASVLATLGGRLLLFGPLTEDDARRIGLQLPNVEVRGLLPSSELIHTLRREADLLSVPVSFEPAARHAMRTNFPSKLTDYTAVGVPLLIQGPEDSSAVQWARDNEGVACLVTDDSAETLEGALRSLRDEPELRVCLATTALRVGQSFFDAESARQTLRRELQRSGPAAA